MRPVVRGDCPKSGEGTDVSFTNYKQARDPLISRIGDYCSYCEICLHGAIDVEHVQPKTHQSTLKLKWTNFLLACTTCNSTKGDEEVDLNDYFWPDRDNTARIFDYLLDQPPRIANGLDPALQPIAERTLGLTGLDRVPGHPRFSDRDRRWCKRLEAWGVALHMRRCLEEDPTPSMREAVLQNAIARGFWSVWMQVFADDVDMRLGLIAWFRGTARECFDDTTRPIPRNGGQA